MRTITAAVVSSLASLVLAGPLTPPPGAVSPTGLTLEEVADQAEPRIPISQATTPGSGTDLFVIDQPGSYYLTGDIVGGTDQRGIRINADNVVLDLNGFRVRGLPGSVNGIFLNLNTGVTVKNGTITGWGGQGLRSNNSDEGVFIDLHCNNNGGSGLEAGDTAIVTRCTASNNGQNGIVVSASSAIVDCTTADNAVNGYFLAVGSLIRGSTSITDGADGINAGIGTMVIDCTVTDPGAIGIDAGTSSTVEGCSVLNARDIGIDASGGSRIVGNTVRDCGVAGIRVSADTLVLENNLDQNNVAADTASGILVTSGDNRIEGNNVTDNDIGIRVTSSGNLIVRNSAAGNVVGYSIATNNSVGLILRATGSGAISDLTNPGANVGIAGAGPWANFLY